MNKIGDDIFKEIYWDIQHYIDCEISREASFDVVVEIRECLPSGAFISESIGEISRHIDNQLQTKFNETWKK